jgi:hypothetical protein
MFSRERAKPVIGLLPTYAEQQAAWVKKVELKPGDKVKVIERCADGEQGWQNFWSEHMDKYVGLVLTAGPCPDADCTTGVPLIFDEASGLVFHFPWFVLMHHNEAFAEAAYLG